MFGVQAYQQVACFTSDPWELVDKLFDGAIRRIDEGKLDKATRIVEEGLLGSLNPGGPLSKGLAESYDIVLFHLRPGGDHQLARSMLVTLREGWQGIRAPQAIAA